MKEPLTEKLLFIIAAMADYNSRCFSWQGALSVPGDPRFNKHQRLLLRYLKNKKEKQKLYKALNNLKRSKLLEEKVLGNSMGYVLTSKGKTKIFRLKMQDQKKQKLPRSQYLMVFFDIPEKMKKTRDIFRLALREMGFERIQKSVWVTSYKITKELKELIKNCNLEKYAKALLVKELEK